MVEEEKEKRNEKSWERLYIRVLYRGKSGEEKEKQQQQQQQQQTKCIEWSRDNEPKKKKNRLHVQRSYEYVNIVVYVYFDYHHVHRRCTRHRTLCPYRWSSEFIYYICFIVHKLHWQTHIHWASLKFNLYTYL